jgi:asparagine synthetase B (glutamine-hydrolysing)
VLEKLRRRGPDFTGEATVPIGDHHSVQLEMIGTLLHMRGAEPTPQPLRGNGNFSAASVGDTKKTSTGDNLLLWNGNIFGGEIEARQVTHFIRFKIITITTLCTCSNVM